MSKPQRQCRIYTHVGQRNQRQSNPRRVVMSLMNRKRRAGGEPLTGLSAAPLMTTLLCTAAFMATGAVAAPQASDSINVSYVASDLTQPEGARTLYRRIQGAARMVCHEPDLRDLV